MTGSTGVCSKTREGDLCRLTRARLMGSNNLLLVLPTSAWDLRLDIGPQNQLILFNVFNVFYFSSHKKGGSLGAQARRCCRPSVLPADRLVSAGLCTSGDVSGSDAAKPVATNESSSLCSVSLEHSGAKWQGTIRPLFKLYSSEQICKKTAERRRPPYQTAHAHVLHPQSH